MTAGNSLQIRRLFPTSATRLYRMWTDPDLMKRWLCPDADMSVPVAEVDVRVGGSYRIVMQNRDGATHTAVGTYEEVVPDERLVFTWQWTDSDVATRVTVTFHAIGAMETELTLTHAEFPDADQCEKHHSGWQGCLAQLVGAL